MASVTGEIEIASPITGRLSKAGSRASLIDDRDGSQMFVLGTNEPAFKYLHTYFLSIFNIILLIAFGALVWLLPGWPAPRDWNDQEIFVFALIVANSIVWLVALVSDRILSHYHHIVRRRGYLEFYNRTECFRRLPFYTFSAMCVSMSVVLGSCMRWIPESADDAQPSRLLTIQLFMSIEILLIMPIYVAYTIIVMEYNWKQPLADVDGVPFGGTVVANNPRQTSANRSRSNTGAAGNEQRSHELVSDSEVGIHDEQQLEQLLDRQADLITYYRHRNHYLMRKLARIANHLEQQRDSALPNVFSSSATINA